MFIKNVAFVFALFAVEVSAETIRERFQAWVERFAMDFESTMHYESTLSKWVENDKYIEEMNGKNLTYTLGHNHFSGMDSVDFSKYIGLSGGFLHNDYTSNLRGSADLDIKAPVNVHSKMSEYKCLKGCVDDFAESEKMESLKCMSGCVERSKSSATSSVDWVSAGAVTPVKDQGQCGSCWSFSTTGALEGAYYTTYGSLPSFSEQQLVDCDNRQHGGKDMGCNGGLMDNAFTWIKKNGGLCTEVSYPYVSGTTKTAGTCQSTCSAVKNSAVVSYTDVPIKSDSAMMQALTLQPVSVAIEADQKAFQLYKSGVFTGECGTNLDHGVLVVGFGSMSGTDYYRIKNSWGTTWGDAGYIYIGRGSQYNDGQGQCGVLMSASYPSL
jgi:C1A family cysteine protease